MLLGRELDVKTHYRDNPLPLVKRSNDNELIAKNSLAVRRKSLRPLSLLRSMAFRFASDFIFYEYRY